MPRSLRALVRLALWIGWTLPLIPFQAVSVAFGLRMAERIPVFYHRAACRILGIAIERRGAISRARPTLFVCNHTSYLDITVLGALIPGSFVAKTEVAGWPGFGLLAKLQRSVFIDRRRRDAARERDAVAGRLAAGDNLILFPEGTSNDGNRVLPFKSALFAVAASPVQGRPLVVQPVSLAYSHLDGLPLGRHLRPLVAWYGDMEMAGHLWRLLGLGNLRATVIFHEPVTIEDFGSRKALAAHCEAAIASGVSEAVHRAGPLAGARRRSA